MRPSLDEMIFSVAREVSRRGTCPRLQTGCVITDKKGHILTTGYNGAPSGLPHCIDEGCIIEANHCIRSVHAEVNAIAHAAQVGVRLANSTLYCTFRPCTRCCLLILQAGVKRVHFEQIYDQPDDEAVKLLASGKIEVHEHIVKEGRVKQS